VFEFNGDIVMKSHFAEEIDDAAPFNETAEEHVWHEHRLPAASRRGTIITAALLAALLCLLLKLHISTPAAVVSGPDAPFARAGTLSEPGDERDRTR
jgi:hypothetical protein